jgi:hypothetical protein
MHFLHLFAAISAITAVAAAPSSHRDGADLQARLTHEIAAHQPLNTYHAPRRFVDGTNSAAKRAFKKHRRGAETAPKSDKSQKRKVRKRSGKCVAKTSTASLSATASATQSSSPASSNSAPSSTAASVSSSTQATESASSASTYYAPSSTLNLQNGAVLSTASPSSKAAPSSQSTSQVATSTSSSSAVPATTSSASSWTSVDTDGNGPFAGQITYYDLGTDGSAIGACGTSLVDSDKVSLLLVLVVEEWRADLHVPIRSLQHQLVSSIRGLEPPETRTPIPSADSMPEFLVSSSPERTTTRLIPLFQPEAHLSSSKFRIDVLGATRGILISVRVHSWSSLR